MIFFLNFNIFSISFVRVSPYLPNAKITKTIDLPRHRYYCDKRAPTEAVRKQRCDPDPVRSETGQVRIRSRHNLSGTRQNPTYLT
jgi:hypothetical protein